MIGGYQILDLRGLDLEITQSEQSLTNKNVLDQLLLFRDHIDKAYDFNQPLENQLKPVLIRFRDKKNGEKIEGATFGELSVKDNYYTFQITGRISGAYTLQIVVEFEEITNDYGNQEWVIKTATIQLTDASNVLEGNIAINGDLTVTGSINGEENPSVKPMYWHGIAMADTGITNIHLQCVIINNSPSLFDKTSLKNLFEGFALSQAGAVINLSGTIYDSEANFDSPVTYAMFLYNSGGGLYCEISGSNLNGHGRITKNYTLDDFFDLLDETYGVNDRCNKLN